MIFAAGLGTRLKPITKDVPKAMAPLNGKPLIYHIINRLHQQGIDEFVVNVYHFSNQITDYLHQLDLDVTIHISDERMQLLDTGGGLKKAVDYLCDDTFLVHNVDIITDLDIAKMLKFHQQKKALVTLAVRNRPSGRCFLFNENYRLVGWRNLKAGDQKIVNKANKIYALPFSGIHILEPHIFDLMEEKGAFSIVDVYLRLTAQQPIYGFRDDEYHWIDVGTPKKLKKTERLLKFGN